MLAWATSAPPIRPPSPPGLTLGWFDGVVVVFLILGLLQGRRRGMSGEFLDLIQWLLIIVMCGLSHQTIGNLFAQVSGFGLFWSYVLVYTGMAIIIKIIFSLFKKSIGEKLMSSGVFGSLEYYLGMAAGMVRFLCLAVLLLALLNARKVTHNELQAQIKSQQKELGKVYFPPLGMIQESVFQDSLTGALAKQHLPMLLIAETGPSEKRERLATQRQREIDELLGNKK